MHPEAAQAETVPVASRNKKHYDENKSVGLCGNSINLMQEYLQAMCPQVCPPPWEEQAERGSQSKGRTQNYRVRIVLLNTGPSADGRMPMAWSRQCVKMMNSALKTRDFVLKTRDFVLKTRNCALKTMNSAGMWIRRTPRKRQRSCVFLYINEDSSPENQDSSVEK